jgi:hypothetical protein
MRRTAMAAFAALLPAGPALAQEGQPVGYPQVAGEVVLHLFNQYETSSTDRRRRGDTMFLRGELAAGIFLSEQLSVQGVVELEPVGEVEPNGGFTGFRYQGGYVEELRLDWKPVPGLRVFGGKFSAPFGRGTHDFPGILTWVRAHEAYQIGESLGFGATYTVLSDPSFGEHDLTAAAFTLDTSFLSQTAFTRKRCCEGDFERYSRNSRQQGGPGNTGRLNNFALALDGDGFSWLPDFSYHLAVLSRGHGEDGTAREWGYAAGLRYEAHWTPRLKTLFFAEHVEFRNAGGRALAEIEEEAVTVAAQQRFTTLGARTDMGPWHAVLAWQRDQQKNSAEPRPTESYLEVSAGRDLGLGFTLDAGYQYARYASEDGGRGQGHSLLSVLHWRARF